MDVLQSNRVGMQSAKNSVSKSYCPVAEMSFNVRDMSTTMMCTHLSMMMFSIHLSRR